MKTAIILAAGRGERLRPITDIMPKPLCQVQGKALIVHHIIRLQQAGYQQIIINHAYLGWQIRQYLGNGSAFGVDIHYSPEPPGALETGGGIVQILRLMPDICAEKFIVVNADIFTDYPFAQLRLVTDSKIHLILIHTSNLAVDFGLTQTGLVCHQNKIYLFSGIAMYSADYFANYAPGRYSVTPLLCKWIAAGLVTGSIYAGVWHDVGSLQRMHSLNLN